MTTAHEPGQLVICNIIKFDDLPVGMLSLGIEIKNLVDITTPSLSIPDF